MSQLEVYLEPIAAWFRSLGLPQPIIQWGHPLMMAIVVFVMGSVVGFTGWRGRTLASNGSIPAATENRSSHRQIAPWMFLFVALGYTGGVLSLVMQQHNILESPHFWTGSTVIVLLTLNAVLSFGNFRDKPGSWRTAHAYIGSIALCLLFLHALLGLKLGLSLD